eukprot:4900091-Ditylum_brightwellii.AAC.1
MSRRKTYIKQYGNLPTGKLLVLTGSKIVGANSSKIYRKSYALHSIMLSLILIDYRNGSPVD